MVGTVQFAPPRTAFRIHESLSDTSNRVSKDERSTKDRSRTFVKRITAPSLKVFSIAERFVALNKGDLLQPQG